MESSNSKAAQISCSSFNRCKIKPFFISYNNTYISYNPRRERVVDIDVRGIFATIFVGSHSKPFNYKKDSLWKRPKKT